MFEELDYNNSLYHHGIKGQKWGVRRYQNEDGSLTPAGKERYKINNNSTLSYISQRGNVSIDESIDYLNKAKLIFSEAKKLEPKISNDVTNSVIESGSKMYGFNNRLKTTKSIAAKLSSDKTDMIKDAIRYTSITDDDSFVSNYYKTKNSLEKKGYKETRCKNYFEMYKEGKVKHKSVQCNYITEDGYEFEIQFQTNASQKAKDLKVPIYEESRNKTTNSNRKKILEKEMVRLAEDVPYPKNISKIKSH